MQKKQLREFKRINATPLMMKLAKQNKPDEPIVIRTHWKTYIYDTKYDIFIRCQTRGKILMTSVFFPDKMAAGISTPTYEIYCNPEGDEFITRILDDSGKEIKWTTSLFYNLGRVYKSSYTDYGLPEQERSGRVWQNYEGKKTIHQFLQVKCIGVEGLTEYQGRSRDRKIQEAEKRQQEPWDKHMALVPKIMPEFKRWAVHDAAEENFIFYGSIKAATGYCTFCEKQVPLIRPIRNKTAECPCCGKKIKFKLQSRIQTLGTEERYAECIQEIFGGFVVRTFRIKSYYRDRDYDDPHWLFNETERYLYFDSGEIKYYTWGLYKNKKYRFIPGYRPYYSRNHSRLYTGNIAVLKKTVLKTSAIDLWPKLPMSASEYLFVEKHNPAVEMLAKMGVFKLAEEIADSQYDNGLLNQSETQIARMLKTDNARLKRLKNMNGGICCLKWLQLEKTADTIWPDHIIKEFSENRIEVSGFSFLPPPVKPVKIYNYIKRQQQKSGESFKQVQITWRDYYNLAEQNKWNVSASQIGWPKDLKKAHADAVLFSKGKSIKEQAVRLEKKWPEVNKILPEIKKFEYRNKKFAIIAPNCIEDMVKEGVALSHCIDHADFYYDRIQKREAYPFFLRRMNSVDTPWYTLEVESSGNIRQKRTTGDNQNADLEEAIPFLKEFMAEYKKKMTAEEKKQGEAASKRRIEEYKELRKNGSRIWHGKLAGQLLADVLEADFMETI